MAMITRSYCPEDEDELITLWEACGLIVPQNDARKDIQRKCRIDGKLLLVGERDGEIVASVMAGYEGHRGWINYLAVSPACRRQGLARQIMDEAQRRLHEKGCPKINLQIRETNVAVKAFYESIGYKQDPVTSMGKRLIKDD